MTLGPLEARARRGTGTAFPTTPYDGQTFVRSDLNAEPFYWDATRAAWLSTRTFQLAYTNQGTVNIGVKLRLYQSPLGTTTLGYLTMWPAVLIEISAARGTTGAATTLDLYNGGSIISAASHVIGSGVVTASATGMNVAIASGSVLNCIATSAMIGGGHIVYTFRRTAT